jgi:hypothetical protein
MRSIRTVLAEGSGVFGATRKLVHRTEGEQIAGSGVTYVNEAWGSLYIGKSGTCGGQWFKTESEATDHYLSMVTPIVEMTA